MTTKPRARDLDHPVSVYGTYGGRIESSEPYALSAANRDVRPDHSDTRVNRVRGTDDRDRALIAAIAQGDQPAFRELHARYYHGITRFVRARIYRSDLIDEIANDTLLVVWQRAADFRGESKVSTWIIGIAWNLCSKALRAIGREYKNASAALGEHGYEPWSQIQLAECVSEAIEQLPAEQRMVLEMFYRLGQSCEEISQVLNCPRNTVKTRLFHGRRKLRDLLPRLAGVSQCT